MDIFKEMSKIGCILIFLCSSLISYADYDFNPSCKSAYNEILSLRFANGRNIIEAEKKLNPSNDVPYLIENYIDFLTLIIGEEKSAYKRLKENKSLRIYRLEKGDKSSPYYNYSLAEVYIQWAFIHIKFKEYLVGAYELNRSYRLLIQNEDKFPGFIPDKKCLGLIHVLIGAIPDEYKWVTTVLKLDGDLKQGTDEIREVMEASYKDPALSYLKTESSFLLSFIYLNFWSDKSRLATMESLLKQDYQDSPLLSYSLAKIYLSGGKNDKAIDILLSVPRGDDYFRFYYLDYITGIAKMSRNDDDADKYLISFTGNFKGSNYIRSAYQKLAWYYLLKGDRKNYDNYILKVNVNGDDVTDEDKQAEKEFITGNVPEIYLLKARLLCDGGYYEKAINSLIQDTSYKTQASGFLEFTYRLARAYDDWGKPQEAIPYYELTINNGKELKYYFAANAALHLGMIYENRKDYFKAKSFYKTCLSMKNEEYKNSIAQKAKSGLRRIQ